MVVYLGYGSHTIGVPTRASSNSTTMGGGAIVEVTMKQITRVGFGFMILVVVAGLMATIYTIVVAVAEVCRLIGELGAYVTNGEDPGINLVTGLAIIVVPIVFLWVIGYTAEKAISTTKENLQ